MRELKGNRDSGGGRGQDGLSEEGTIELRIRRAPSRQREEKGQRPWGREELGVLQECRGD